MERIRLRKQPIKRIRLPKRTPAWVKAKADKAERTLKRRNGNGSLDKASLYYGSVKPDVPRGKVLKLPSDRTKWAAPSSSKPPVIKDDEDFDIDRSLDLMDTVMKFRTAGRPYALEDTNFMRQLLYGMGAIQCTMEEVSAVLGVSIPTLDDFFRRHPIVKDIWEDGKPGGRASLRRRQFRMAEKSAPMAIWLGKQYLDQRDKVDVAGPNGGPLQSVTIDAAQLAKLTPQQLASLQDALKILKPEMFDGIQQQESTPLKAIEYDPES